jgi:hypothetical protein
MWDRTLSYHDRFGAKWGAGFRRKKRSQNCQRLRSEGNGNGHRHCGTFHVAASLSDFYGVTSKIFS